MENKPWMNSAAIEFLQKIITKDFLIFEYGSGGSTIWLSSRCKYITSIEGNVAYYDIVKAKLKNTNTINCSIHRINQPYNTAIEVFPDNHFDLVIVDGRNRMRCIKNAYSKVKEGGYLMLDDSHREWYRKSYEILKDWEMNKYYITEQEINVPPQSTSWQKPIT